VQVATIETAFAGQSSPCEMQQEFVTAGGYRLLDKGFRPYTDEKRG